MKALAQAYKYKLSRHKAIRDSHLEQFDASSIGDLSFLLLIFFIVTSSFLLKQGLFLSLPSSQSVSQSIDAKRVLDVAPKENGFLTNGTLINEENLRKAMQEKKEQVEQPVILIQMTEGVPYNRLITLLSISREEEINKVSLKFK